MGLKAIEDDAAASSVASVVVAGVGDHHIGSPCPATTRSGARASRSALPKSGGSPFLFEVRNGSCWQDGRFVQSAPPPVQQMMFKHVEDVHVLLSSGYGRGRTDVDYVRKELEAVMPGRSFG